MNGACVQGRVSREGKIHQSWGMLFGAPQRRSYGCGSHPCLPWTRKKNEFVVLRTPNTRFLDPHWKAPPAGILARRPITTPPPPGKTDPPRLCTYRYIKPQTHSSCRVCLKPSDTDVLARQQYLYTKPAVDTRTNVKCHVDLLIVSCSPFEEKLSQQQSVVSGAHYFTTWFIAMQA